ncbi:MAG: molybdopterin-dependent oxidoreductase [Dehalococcoidales bacterium]|nr:molybdopterin-dependent oxidoreductase [Dehalococcoidales bacterium]
MALKVIKSDCIMCINSCGINAYVDDGRLVRVEGMPEHPVSEGVICPRGEALPEYVYSPDRLKYPMKKAGGGWQRISWNEALNTIAEKLQAIKEKHGAEALAVYNGSIGTENIELATFAQIFCGAYGTPNLLSVEGNCFRSRIMARQMTFGSYLIEEPWNARCVIVWGQNMDRTRMTMANKIYKALDSGTLEQLIVIDPRRIPMAEKGIYIRIRPGTDCALMLAMLNVIIAEGLYDKDFVEKYTLGFNQLAEHVKSYSPEKVAEITWVPAEDIRRIARLFATVKPASIVPGTAALDQHINGFQNNRALSLLQTVTGNIDIPGGWVGMPYLRLGARELRVTETGEAIGAKEYPLFHGFWGRKAPFSQEMLFADAVLERKPYPITALIVNGGNPVLTLPDSSRIKQALEKLDFMVVIDLFLTETAELADIVLPACSFPEKSGVGYVYGVTAGIPYLLLRKKIIEPIGESWADWKIWTEIGRRMSYGEFFPWQTEEEVIDFFLEPSGLTREQLERDHPEGAFYAEKKYRTYQTNNYRTPSGKIEIYSETLKENGYDPLPVYVEPSQSPVSAPELAKDYPLILTTGARIPQYTHTQFRNISTLKRAAVEPVAEIHPDTAAQYGLADGDMMRVETNKGQIAIKVKTTEDLAPGIISIPHGWAEANVNLLTSLEPRDPVTGYAELKTLLCRIKKI